MAHLVETMAYAGAKPWHKLGFAVSNDPGEACQDARRGGGFLSLRYTLRGAHGTDN